MRPWKSPSIRWLFIALACTAVSHAQEAQVVEKEGRVVVTKAGARPVPAQIGVALTARDKLGTGESSRAVLKMSAKWFARVDEETDVEIMPAAFGAKDKEALKIALGGAFIYSREEEGELKVQTPTATGGLRGTQLVVRVSAHGKTFMQVLEGEVDLANDLGRVLLKAGEAGEAERGQAPRKTASIETRNLLQWTLYYPAVLQPDELGLTEREKNALAASLDAYRQGDLLGALDQFPAGYASSANARLYHASVLLATGRVDAARAALRDIPTDNPHRRALERMIAAVAFSPQPDAGTPTTAGEALAESYYRQSRSQLDAARAAAKGATELAPDSGYAWTRLAELEFSFGRTREARSALERGLALAPRNAQAHALRGYLFSAENRIAAARASFEEAIRLDGALGNAWLGLGLTKIKQGQLAEGGADLQTAATVEPTRAFFYSYHGKALSLAGADALARKDFDLAKQLDPKDPTPWLYSAIQTQQENRYNTAIAEVQQSLRLNDNRRVYRSQFLLDQDSAVRSSNLAKIYQNNGMTDLAVREATRAVESDYTNASAHQFLANSFDALRDPRQVSLRYETAWLNEQLLANLLSPVGGGPLSQFVSQQEYSKLLASDGIGGSSITEWREDGSYDEHASLFATFGKLSGGLDFSARHDPGTRPNNDSAEQRIDAQIKYQATADDVAYSLVEWGSLKQGDLLQTYDNSPGNPGLRFKESQEPAFALMGWNHRWGTGNHTLFMGGRLAADQALVAPGFVPFLLFRDQSVLQPNFLRPTANGTLEYTSPALRNAAVPPASIGSDGSLKLSDDFQRAFAPFLGQGAITGTGFLIDHRLDASTRVRFEIYSGELQHIWQRSRNTLLLGARWQDGEFTTSTRLDLLNASLVSFAPSPVARQQVSAHFGRRSFYAYDFFAVSPSLTVIAGAASDHIERPDNFRRPPVNDREVKAQRLNLKFGFTFSPSPRITIRGAHTEALGGVTFDESVRLEPVQLAGFNQAFRTVIPESLVGSIETPVYKNSGLSVEGNFTKRTWWGASFNRLTEEVRRTIGTLDVVTAPVFPGGRAILPSSTAERLAYREKVFAAGINQLIGGQFAIGANYRFTRAELHDTIPEIPVSILPFADLFSRATLEEAMFTSNWNSSSGWFGRWEADWYSQDLHGTAGGQTKLSPRGDHFWQYSAQIGHRFRHNTREISAGVLNLTDRDYQLSPLAVTREPPRARTFFVRCRVGF